MESGHLGVVLEPSSKGVHLPKVRLVYDTRTNSRIRPKDADLGDPANGYGKIMGYEKPDAWGINVLEHIGVDAA
jgi:hypothetical protein